MLPAPKITVPAGFVMRYSAALGVDDAMIFATRGHAVGSLGLALVNFERNGYISHWDPERSAALHTRVSLAEAWRAHEMLEGGEVIGKMLLKP